MKQKLQQRNGARTANSTMLTKMFLQQLEFNNKNQSVVMGRLRQKAAPEQAMQARRQQRRGAVAAALQHKQQEAAPAWHTTRCFLLLSLQVKGEFFDGTAQ